MRASQYRRLFLLTATCLLSPLIVISSSARAEGISDFFKGKTVTISVGFGPGGSYDYYPRMFARFMGKHIPGNPNIIVQNMPGAGSLRAANYLYNLAPRDGTALGVVTQTLMLEGPFGTPGVKFNAAEFSYIGRMTGVLELMIVWHEARAKNIYDTRKIETITGGNGPTSVSEGYPRVLNAFAGTKFKIVSGYNAMPQIMLAMERREIDASAGTWSSLLRNHKEWLDNKKIHLLAQTAHERTRELPDTPTMIELGISAEDKASIALYTSVTEVSRSLIGPPNMLPDRLRALREAFQATTRDPEFLAEIQKAGIEFDPAPGEYLESLAQRVAATPPDIVKRTAAALQAK